MRRVSPMRGYYKEFVKHDEEAMGSLKNVLINSEDPDLGKLNISVRFVESHFQDIKTIIKLQ